jgi:hypothetical protein
MPVVDYYRQHGKVVEVSILSIYLDEADDRSTPPHPSKSFTRMSEPPSTLDYPVLRIPR